MSPEPISGDVDEVMSKLAAAEQADLTALGLRQAYAIIPNSVSPADLPALVNLPGAMTLTPMGSDEDGDEDQEDRRWSILLLVAPRGAGYPGEAFNQVTPWFAKLARFFSSHQSLGTVNATKVTLTGDSGAEQPITFADQLYYGSRFSVMITGRRRSPYAQNE